MGNKKLDELFQEKFNDFEELPDEKVWQAIEASLNKKKRRFIPLWWKLGGVAAVLAIGLFIMNPFSDTAQEKPVLTDVEQNASDSLERNTTRETRILDTTDAKGTQLTDTNSQDMEEGGTNDHEVSPSKNTRTDYETDVNNARNINGKNKSQLTSSQKKNREKSPSRKTVPKGDILVTDVPKTKSKENIDSKKATILQENNQERIVEKSVKQNPIIDNASEEAIVRQEDSSKATQNEKKLILKNDERTEIAQNDSQESESKTIDEELKDAKKKSIFDEIQEQDEVVAQNETKNRWSAGPSIAPVYFDAFGEGSPVHSILVPNSKSGDTNLSYGLSIAYEINDRLSVRSGLHKVDYGYDTGEIEFSSSLDGATSDQMDNINYAATARTLVVRSRAGSTAVSVNESSNDQAFDASTNSVARDGSMSQQFGYLEVPLELNYALVDRKVGINLIGGFSSLFLVNNSISLTSGSETTEMGEANNVNDINFSTNIGLGIDYNFTPRVQLNIEPLFKYQLNTFNEVDGTFNPFSIGIYSGVTFRF